MKVGSELIPSSVSLCSPPSPVNGRSEKSSPRPLAGEDADTGEGRWRRMRESLTSAFAFSIPDVQSLAVLRLLPSF
jgi:hypothetical protein